MLKQKLNKFKQMEQQNSKPQVSKSDYGRPPQGSLTEMRGQKANIHVCKEMLELCYIINSEGVPQSDDCPDLKVIRFEDLFNIYTHISNKVVGILLRARKMQLVQFEGEILFQRRDDDVPIFMLKPIKEIENLLLQKAEDVSSQICDAPKATTLIVDHTNRKF